LVAALPGGRFPASQPALLALPGIGPYTAAAISTIAHDQAATVVDGNIERVMARLFAVQTPLPAAKKQLWQLADDLSPKIRPGDYAQALMDLGATVCTPKSPRCTCCPISTQCRARAQDCAATLPKRSPKKPKPTRHGHAYLGQRSDGAWLLERRVGSGLLGGMLCWPCSEWRTLPALADTSDEAANKAPSSADWPVNADWQDTGAVIRHTFTHFHLVLNIVTADLPLGTNPARGFFVPHAEFDPFALPSLMRKAHAALRPVEPKAAGA
ncbi:MAG: NUDIX domain-containing protein, partial [Rhodobacteraceae bacterium]|nr:NUDIX domain-containing protein [Paracoccaceae bacterium]